jgi:putative protease
VLNLLRRESLAGISEKIVKSFKRASLDSSQADFSGVEDIVRQIDILDPVKTSLPEKHFSGRGPSVHPVSAGDSSEENPSAGNLVSAYFYSWDGQVPSIACNADWYELPVWSFMKEQAFSGLRQLQEAEPGARIAVALPPGYIGVSRTIFTDLLKRLALQGVEAVVSGNPGNPLLCSALGMISFQDSGSNVMNSATASLLKKFGARSIVPSVELSMDPLIEMAKSVFADSDCILELPAYGRLRLMYSEHCPVGYNRSGCKACASGVAFAMKDRKGVSFPVICHSEACTVDILNGDNLCAPAELVMMAKLCRIRARLYFTDETVEERKALISGFRNVIQHPDLPQMEREIEKIRHIAVDIASVRNCGLTKGHYQRGMH